MFIRTIAKAALVIPAIALVGCASDRGVHGWLDSRNTFSFADYYNARFMKSGRYA